MGAPVHSIRIGELPSGEGDLNALVQSWEKPDVKTVLSQDIGTYTLMHGECSNLEIRKVSEETKVLICRQCLLRIGFPSNVVSLSDLKDWFE